MQRAFGQSGIDIIVRIMGLVLAVIAIDMMASGPARQVSDFGDAAAIDRGGHSRPGNPWKGSMKLLWR